VKFDGALGDVELAGDFLVGKIFEERIENFLFATAEIGDGIGLQTAALAGEDGIDEAGQELARNPEATAGDKRESADELIASFDIGEKALHAEAQERITVGVIVLLPDDDEASFGMAFQNIGQKRAGGGLGGMRVNDVNLRLRRLKVAKIGRERGFELFGDNFEWSLGENAFELAQHQGVRREDANGQFSGCAFGSHYSKG